MTPLVPPAVIPLDSFALHPEVCPIPTACYRCWGWVGHLDQRGEQPVLTSRRCQFLLSPGDPYSVVWPPGRRRLRPIYTPDLSLPPPPPFLGIPCVWIRTLIGLEIEGVQRPWPFDLLALMPRRPVPDLPPLLRLGAEFLTTQRARVELDAATGDGRIIIP